MSYFDFSIHSIMHLRTGWISKRNSHPKTHSIPLIYKIFLNMRTDRINSKSDKLTWRRVSRLCKPIEKDGHVAIIILLGYISDKKVKKHQKRKSNKKSNKKLKKKLPNQPQFKKKHQNKLLKNPKIKHYLVEMKKEKKCQEWDLRLLRD